MTIDCSDDSHVLSTVDRSTVDSSDESHVLSMVDRSTVDNSYNAYVLSAENCSLNLTIPALLSMTASLCGPNTMIEGQENGFQTSLNAYLLAVCDSGGRKTDL